jgi:ADP-ribose pyrophosphatase
LSDGLNPAVRALKPWTTIGTKPMGDFRIFKIRADDKISPRTNRSHQFYVLECPDWVNVIALTARREVVMVEQYRAGSNTVELEIPGGILDAEDRTPEAGAARELREETGYEGENGRTIGTVLANPAFMNNKCHTVLFENCRCVHPVNFDQGEDLVTRLVPESEISSLVATGIIRHSLIVAALFHFQLLSK